MNILIDINHPAHVHLLRNVFFLLKEKGHEVTVVVKEIPSAMRLMDLYGIPYTNIGKKDDALMKKGLDQLVFDRRLLSIVRKHHIDIGVGSSINIAHASRLSKMKSIILDDDDDEVEPLFVKFGHPFADTILSPVDTQRRSKKTIYVNAYHELAYLHPSRFTPDSSVLQDAGVKEDEPFFILRFNAFKAHHDVGVVGLTIENKRRLVNYLMTKGKVFITTERDVDDEFKPYQLKVSPEKAHSLMYYATMLVGDSQTMTSEAAVLGTPAIRCNTFVGRIHYLEEEEHKYNLTYGFRPEQSETMFQKIEELLSMPDLKQEWQSRRQKMLSDKIDYAQFLTWFIGKYPESKKTMKDHPEYQFRFK
jgi:predicted glycosyltransferase